MKILLASTLALVASGASAQSVTEGRFSGVLPSGEIVVQFEEGFSVCQMDEVGGAMRLASCKPLILTPPKLLAAEPFSEEVFSALLEASDCRMSESEASKLLPGLGYAKEEVGRVVQDMRAKGLIVMDGDTVVLKSEACQ